MSPPQSFQLNKCTPRTEFAQSLPAELEKVWIISRDDNTVQIVCNGEQVLKMTLSDETCTGDANWQSQWDQTTAGMKFNKKLDTGSDSYRLVPLKGRLNL